MKFFLEFHFAFCPSVLYLWKYALRIIAKNGKYRCRYRNFYVTHGMILKFVLLISQYRNLTMCKDSLLQHVQRCDFDRSKNWWLNIQPPPSNLLKGKPLSKGWLLTISLPCLIVGGSNTDFLKISPWVSIYNVLPLIRELFQKSDLSWPPNQLY